jgi:fido (protein-threonine AMPylation protein)
MDQRGRKGKGVPSYNRRRQGRKRTRSFDNNNNNNNNNNISNDGSTRREVPSVQKEVKTVSAPPLYPLTPNAVFTMVTGGASASKTGTKTGTKTSIKTKTTVAKDGERGSDVIVKLRLDREMGHQHSTSHNDRDPQAVLATLSDGGHYIQVVLLQNPVTFTSSNKTPSKDLIVSVQGYVTTQSHPHSKYQIPPFLCLTSFSVLTSTSLTSPTSISSLGNPFQLQSTPPSQLLPSPSKQQPSSSSSSSTRLHGGTAGTFLTQLAPFLTNTELAGASSLQPPDDSKLQNEKQVSDAIAHHAAMMTLSSSTTTTTTTRTTTTSSTTTPSPTNHNHETPTASTSPSSSSSTPTTSRPTDQAVQNYNKALSEFSNSQLDRQNASLVSNAGREAAERATTIVDRYKQTLQHALQCSDQSLTPTLLCQWHGMLLEGLHDNAGTIRTRTVRAGLAVFCHPDQIGLELARFCHCLESLETRLNISVSLSPNNNHATHAILFAAIAMFGVVDIHPFMDGNGRLSRIVANWALRKATKMPFSINLFATPAQRTEYVAAIEQTRQYLSLNPCYQVTKDDLLQAMKLTGVFVPLVDLIMDRVSKACLELTRVCEEKYGFAAEAAEAQAARRARERAAQGTCLICLDDKPNIATLCCGKATHLNCIAEWLAQKNSCPVCRSELPSVTPRVIRRDAHPDPNRNDNLNQDTHGDTESTRDDDDEEDLEESDDAARILVRVLESVFDTTAEDTTSDDSNNNNNAAEMENTEEYTTSVETDDITTPGRQERAPDADTTEDDTTILEGAVALPPLPPQVQYCNSLYCRNLPAADCANSLCGRCCVLGGEFRCPRHNS